MEKHYGGASRNFVNLMFSVLLVIGLLEWVDAGSMLQYVLFLFTFVLIIAYWRDRKHIRHYPPKSTAGLLVDVLAVFALFLVVRSALLPLGFYFAALAILRAIDALGISRAISEYVLKNADASHLKLQRSLYFLEASIYVLFEGLTFQYGFPYVVGLTALILVWLFGRVSEGVV
ncbi:Uncharacterised protein [uncultured archaeon]|nr:Uncharacterised protein [uncultured archaeon]